MRAVLIVALLVVTPAAADPITNAANEILRLLYPPKLPIHVPFPTTQKEEFPRPSAPLPTATPAPEPEQEPPVVTRPEPKPKKITVRKVQAETFKRKPKEPVRQRKPTAGECAQMRVGVSFYGRDGVKAEGRKRGYSAAQVERALKDCGL